MRECSLMHAIARLVLHPYITNIQVPPCHLSPCHALQHCSTVDRFMNRRPLGLGLIFFSGFRRGLDPVFRVFQHVFTCMFSFWRPACLRAHQVWE